MDPNKPTPPISPTQTIGVPQSTTPVQTTPTVEPTQPTPPTLPTPSKSKLSIFLVISLLLIMLGAGGYLGYQKLIQKPLPQTTPVPTASASPVATDNQDKTADWKDYSVKDFKLTFKAPFAMNVDIVGSTITIQDYPLNAPPPDNFFKAVISISKTGVIDTQIDKKSQATADEILATFVFEDGCLVTGCNLEICRATKAEPVASICLWKEEYACYKTAKCEVQADGQCAWTQTTELKNCLQKYGSAN